MTPLEKVQLTMKYGLSSDAVNALAAYGFTFGQVVTCLKGLTIVELGSLINYGCPVADIMNYANESLKNKKKAETKAKWQNIGDAIAEYNPIANTEFVKTTDAGKVLSGTVTITNTVIGWLVKKASK